MAPNHRREHRRVAAATGGVQPLAITVTNTFDPADVDGAAVRAPHAVPPGRARGGRWKLVAMATAVLVAAE